MKEKIYSIKEQIIRHLVPSVNSLLKEIHLSLKALSAIGTLILSFDFEGAPPSENAFLSNG